MQEAGPILEHQVQIILQSQDKDSEPLFRLSLLLKGMILELDLLLKTIRPILWEELRQPMLSLETNSSISRQDPLTQSHSLNQIRHLSRIT